MNAFSIVILAFLVLEFSIDLVADLLNLRALKMNIPQPLEGIFPSGEYRKSQQYIRVTTRFSLVSGAFSLILLLAFWFAGGFNYFDQFVRGLGLSLIADGLLYTGGLLLAYNLLTLPFGIYATFVIEQRFGFNRTTPRTFILDELKGLLLALVLGGPLLAGILALFQYAGAYAWLYCWAGVTVFSLLMQYVAPTLIMPLFNKFTPMASGELREAILKYIKSVDFPVWNILVMDGSRRSAKSNAFFTGFGRHKRIALYDTLIAKHTVPELVAVLAHEIGHYKKKHILQGVIIGILHTGLLLFLLSLFVDSPGLQRAFYMDNQSVYAGLLFFGLLYAPLEMVLSVIMQVISRRNEYSADRFAAETIEEPHQMTAALKKLASANLSNLNPHPFYVFLNYSHPPLLQRLQAIEQAAKERSSNRG